MQTPRRRPVNMPPPCQPSSRALHALGRHLVPPQKLLGIDFGTRFLGLAISDGSCLVAAPHRVLDERSASKVFGFGPDSLGALITQQRVAALVVGLPFTSGGGEDVACARVRRFVRDLHANGVTNRPVFFWDEAGTSQEARRMFENVHRVMKFSDQKRRGSDKIAACLVLQSFLDHFNRVRDSMSRSSFANSSLSPSSLPSSPSALHAAMSMQLQASRRASGGASLIDQLPRNDPYVALPPLSPSAAHMRVAPC